MEEPAPRRRGKGSRAQNQARERALIRKAFARSAEFEATDPQLVRIASIVLGAGHSVQDLVVSALTATKSDLQVLADAVAIMDADPVEAGVVAATLDSRLRQVWRIFAELGVVSADVPASDVKAAIALAKAVHSIDQTEPRRILARVGELLRR